MEAVQRQFNRQAPFAWIVRQKHDTTWAVRGRAAGGTGAGWKVCPTWNRFVGGDIDITDHNNAALQAIDPHGDDLQPQFWSVQALSAP